MTKKEYKEFSSKLQVGLNLAYERMIEFKKYKKSTIIVERDGKIVELDPFTMKIVKTLS
jgi:hypothetical protein